MVLSFGKTPLNLFMHYIIIVCSLTRYALNDLIIILIFKLSTKFLCINNQLCIYRVSDGSIPVWTHKLCTQTVEKLIQKSRYLIKFSTQLYLYLTRHLILVKCTKGWILELFYVCAPTFLALYIHSVSFV